MTFEITDWYCGAGGFSSVATAHKVIGGADSALDALACFQKAHPAAKAAARTLPASLGDCGFPPAGPRSYWHFSPPCTAFSSARRGCRDLDDGVRQLAWSIEMAVRYGLWFSIENVATDLPVAIAERYKALHPKDVDFAIVCASMFGVPQRRTRLIIARPSVIKRLRDCIVKPNLVTMKEAFATRGLAMPGSDIKGATTNASGNPCMRKLNDQSIVCVASRPPHFLRSSGKWTAATADEIKVLMDLPAAMPVPSDKRGQARVLGNAIPGGLSKAILAAAQEAAEVERPFVGAPDDAPTFKDAVAGADACVAWVKMRERAKHVAEKEIGRQAGLSAAGVKRLREEVVTNVIHRMCEED